MLFSAFILSFFSTVIQKKRIAFQSPGIESHVYHSIQSLFLFFSLLLSVRQAIIFQYFTDIVSIRNAICDNFQHFSKRIGMDSIKTIFYRSKRILVSSNKKLDLKISKIDSFDHISICKISKNVRHHI
jgi:5-methylthioribose kinase